MEKQRKTPLPADTVDRPIDPGLYPEIDTDLARDNVENDIPAADRENAC